MSRSLRDRSLGGRVLSVRMTLRCAFVALSIPMLADTAAAQSRGTDQQRNACMGDAFRYCLSAIPNHKRIESCLRANRRSLSASCHAEIFDDEPAPKRVEKRVVQGSGHAPE